MPALSSISRACLITAAIAAAALAVGIITQRPALWQPAAVALAISLPFTLRANPNLRGYQFTGWIIAVVVAAMIYPQRVLHVGTVDLRNKWIIVTIVQLVMFGMGTKLRLSDLAGVVTMPWSVCVGIVCHFTIMPLVGFSLTKIFSLPNEIAAGIILIGSCSAGLSSNVMAYLARANLALSITMTSVTTLLAPIMTPLWMKLLAGDKVDVHFVDMMADIIKLVIVPIGAALLHDYLKHASSKFRRGAIAAAAAGVAWLASLALGVWTMLAPRLSEHGILAFTMANYIVAAIIAGVVYHALTRQWPAIERWMPVASMFGIVYYTAVTTAFGRDYLLEVGALLFAAAVIHNALGYVLGYWMSRALGVPRASARTVAFEVGLQNGAMATGIAGGMNMLGTMGLAAAVFSPWMNVSGSILANYWRKRPVSDGEPESPSLEGRG